ncbi:hypothetical protein [Clostridium rectalis]|uniref:hypothetical protein n=1 Tax=Clostridium rectalis TaxID=2040295 RepID=UPI000F64097A|nr:hypothetical protein [Clostridium rectalis]
MNKDSEKSFLKEIYSLSNKSISKRYKYLGEGISRKVYALNDKYVIKVAKGAEGHYQNMVENYVYNHVDRKLKKYLCPIIYFKPRFIIMRRAEPIADSLNKHKVKIEKLRKEKNAIEDIENLTNKFLLLREDIYSITSWGKIQDEYVLIDYGCTSYTGDFIYDIIFDLLKE